MNMEKTASILIRSFWLGILFLGAWANVFIVWNTRLYVSHAEWFYLSVREFALIHYGAMLLFALGLVTFFLLPYLGMRWLIYSQNHRQSPTIS